MSVAKKSEKPVVVKVLKSRKSNASNALHEKLVKLFSRPNGATINDLNDAGFKYSARQALKSLSIVALRHPPKSRTES